MERQNLNISQYLWWVERDSVLIAYYDSSTDKFTSPIAGQTITLFYIQRPDKFLIDGEAPERDGFSGTDEYLEVSLANGLMTNAVMLEQECEIPEQFHEALISRVVANGYERRAETIQLASYFLNKYAVGVRDCKSYAYRGRDGSQTSIKTQDF
jgi:hypothetical protein|tara:strand:+ start:2418 stop:2879 length:462 start_codon:yes stop_codon:yes gene_type:complete